MTRRENNSPAIFKTMVNLKTGKSFSTAKDSLVVEDTSRRDFLKGGLAAILAAGVAPSLCGNTARGIGYRNLAGRLAMFSGGGGEPKPYDREVKWLTANDGAYIDTAFSLDFTTDDWELKFGSTLPTSSSAVLYIAANYEYASIGYTIRNKTFQLHLNTVSAQVSVISKYNVGDIVICSKIGDAYQLGTDEETLHFTSTSTTKFYLFNSGSARYDNNLFVQSLKIWRNGTLVLDMIPVVKDNVGYLYDRCGTICPLTGTSLYANAGTGAFTWEEL